MTVKIADLMAKRVIAAELHHTVEHVRRLMERNRIHAVPVVGPNGAPFGIITTADLARRVKDASSFTIIIICYRFPFIVIIFIIHHHHHLLSLPIFIQGRFSSSLFSINCLPLSHSIKEKGHVYNSKAYVRQCDAYVRQF